MKDFMSLAEERFSVRDFSDRPIEPEKMDKLMHAAKIAPTAGNRQPFRIYILKSEAALAKIRGLTRCAFNAPVVLLMTYNVDEQWQNPIEAGIASGQQDVSIIATHIMLEAWNLGIGSCWVNLFPNSETERAFDLPENERAVLLMPIGYAAENVKPAPWHTEYRDMAELVKTL